jgi:hypothetical protein
VRGCFVEPQNSFLLSYKSLVALLFFVGMAVVDILIIDIISASLNRLDDEKGRTEALVRGTCQ